MHKCVKPARIFINRMLDLLRSPHATQGITLTADFKCDLQWFAMFLPQYNGVSMYDHRVIDMSLELDDGLTGFGGRCGWFVYHLPISRGFRDWTIVHLEMVNIFLALRLFAQLWSTKKIEIHCDNQAVVTVVRKNSFLATSARNIWYLTAVHDIDVQYSHIKCASNQLADTLSRWQGSLDQVQFLHSQICDSVWLPVSENLLDRDPCL